MTDKEYREALEGWIRKEKDMRRESTKRDYLILGLLGGALFALWLYFGFIYQV